MDRCHCACHADSRIVAFEPPNVTDPIAAATACDSCRDAHCPALLSQQHLPNDREYPRCAEMAVWVDPPLGQGDGEGTE